MLKKKNSKNIPTPPKYVISKEEDGILVRSVVPYIHEFKTFAKGRWLGCELLAVLCKEFGAQPCSYWEEAIACGNVRINGKIVPLNYIFRNSDALLHRTHR